MKTLKLKMLICSFLLLTTTIYGQGGYIDSLKLIPTNPTANDEVFIVCYASFPSSNCELFFTTDTINGNNIDLTLYYNVGAAQTPCESIDTISLGILSEGQYQLTCDLMNPGAQEIFDTDTLNFVIAQTSGVVENTGSWLVSVSPNPSSEYVDVFFEGNSNKILELQIFNSLYQKVWVETIESGVKNQVYISDLNNGLYFLNVTDGIQNVTTRIIKNEH